MTEPAVHDVLDGLEVLVCGLDDHGKIQVFNRPCERLTGIRREDAIEQSWLDLFARGQRTDEVVSLWAKAREDEPAGPYEALCRKGRNLRWHFSRIDRRRAPPVALWAVGIDVTREREALVRAREIERMVTLANLVSGLAHELRNPLNGALLQLALGERYLAHRPDETLEPIVVAARSEIRRISRILDDFLMFVRPQPIHLQRTDVRRVVARAIERSIPKAQAAGISVTLEPGGETLAEIDASRVESAVYHLIANAIDAAAEAMEREVSLRIAAAGNSSTIEVADRGAGLPSEDTPIFAPFFTTKKGGTGLGLAIVQRVAADHGGEITYERRDGTTTFRLKLPIVGGVVSESP